MSHGSFACNVKPTYLNPTESIEQQMEAELREYRKKAQTILENMKIAMVKFLADLGGWMKCIILQTGCPIRNDERVESKKCVNKNPCRRVEVCKNEEKGDECVQGTWEMAGYGNFQENKDEKSDVCCVKEIESANEEDDECDEEREFLRRCDEGKSLKRCGDKCGQSNGNGIKKSGCKKKCEYQLVKNLCCIERDLRQFRPEEIKVKLHPDSVIILAKNARYDYCEKIRLPEGVDGCTFKTRINAVGFLVMESRE